MPGYTQLQQAYLNNLVNPNPDCSDFVGLNFTYLFNKSVLSCLSGERLFEFFNTQPIDFT